MQTGVRPSRRRRVSVLTLSLSICLPAHALSIASSGALALLATCLLAGSLHAQSPVFADAPDSILGDLPGLRPDMPVHTLRDIAVIEMNAPSYIYDPEKSARLDRLDWLMTLEHLRIHEPAKAFHHHWYEFVAAKAPTLSEPEMDAIAQDWWSAMGSRAVTLDEHHVWRKATFKEVRAHFQVLRTGNDNQAFAAVVWLISAEPLKRENRTIRLLPQAQNVSPLAHLLARDIAEELTMYTDAETVKLRNAVKRLVTGKFRITDDTGTEHIVTQADVDTLLDAFSTNPEEERRALQILEEWLKRAIDADLQAFEDTARADSHSH